MLQNPDDQIRACLDRARMCGQRASEARNLDERDEWRCIESRYLNLVKSIEFTRRLEQFTSEA